MSLGYCGSNVWRKDDSYTDGFCHRQRRIDRMAGRDEMFHGTVGPGAGRNDTSALWGYKQADTDQEDGEYSREASAQTGCGHSKVGASYHAGRDTVRCVIHSFYRPS